jgi:hypothetical protein
MCSIVFKCRHYFFCFFLRIVICFIMKTSIRHFRQWNYFFSLVTLSLKNSYRKSRVIHMYRFILICLVDDYMQWPISKGYNCFDMRQAQPVWRTKSYNFFFKLFGWSYLSLTYGCSVHFTYAALPPKSRRKRFFN